MTRLIRSLSNLPPEARGGVVTIGNFDGVHLGHQALLAQTVARAKESNSPSIVVTFEPHPFEFFNRDNLTIPRLTRLREKFLALQDCGVDYVLILKFNQQLASLSASDFVTTILVDGLNAQHIVVGDDFHFGSKRQGNLALLESMGVDYGFTAEAMPTLVIQGERVSSTRIRKVLAEGDHKLANELLGHPYSMLGRVTFGRQLGRQWGFPTANINVHRPLTPVLGVYAVILHGVAEQGIPGAANIGTRPTVDGTRTLLEVHLLNFNQDIYGRYVRVEFCHKLREEVRYPTIDLLKQQIAVDVKMTEQYFQEQGINRHD